MGSLRVQVYALFFFLRRPKKFGVPTVRPTKNRCGFLPLGTGLGLPHPGGPGFEHEKGGQTVFIDEIHVDGYIQAKCGNEFPCNRQRTATMADLTWEV